MATLRAQYEEMSADELKALLQDVILLTPEAETLAKEVLARKTARKTKTTPETKTVVKTYWGKHETAYRLFLVDKEKMAKQGCAPVSENWIPGSWGVGSFIIALLLCFVLIGILVFLYMLIVKPAGKLVVTYEEKSPEKVCPKCAETIKAPALVCRYCGHAFPEG
jgi:hypothetical protein